ncbi:T9SS type A sorting domain-containing protein [uncultured Flavobacterium sp.]|uniref:DUF7619 domain-containing protein n=1 Tax=uncultured Flavobacterium sp. TaxID=165435 RepID=UPI0030EE9375|tara:strand:+ start:159 stop:2891 length:2733 start_codon:yes stop_codon:yes gene_type:complete
MKKIILLLLFITGTLYAQPPIAQPDDLIVCDDNGANDGFAYFDLTVNESQTLNGLNPSSYNIKYYNTLSDAQNNAGAFVNESNYYNFINPQTIYVRVEENANPTNYAITSFNLIVNLLPTASIGLSSPICSGDSTSLTINGTPNATVQYTVNGAAQASITLDPNGLATLSFANLTVDTTICLVDVTSSTTACTQSLTACETILVNQTPNIIQPPNLVIYENPFDGFATFDLTQNEFIILNGINTLSVNVLYYGSLMDAQFGVNPFSNPNSYFNISNPETIYVRVEDNVTGCYAITNFDLIVIDSVNGIVYIPDANFKAKLIALGVDTNTDGEIQFSEALVSTTLNVSNSNIADLTGIEAFTNLATLNCSINNLTTLNCSSNFNLTSLYFVANLQLQSVFIKNGSNESSNIDSGSWLENFLSNNSPSLAYVCVDQNQVANIQSLVSGSVNVNSYCTTNPGGNYNSISGIIQYDFDNNGCNALDSPASYMALNLSLNAVSINGSVFTNFNGNYIYNTNQTGIYELTPNLENPTFFTVSPNQAVVNVSVIDNTTTTQDFCITANGVHPDLEIVIAPITPARPGFDAVYLIVYRNIGNTTLSQQYGINFFYDENVLDFVSTTYATSSVGSGSLSWDYANLKPFENRSFYVTLNVNSPTETPAVNIGDVLTLTASILPSAGDENTFDNLFQFNQTVVGSYDPNDITCIQGEVVAPSYIGQYLHYVINFENTGTYQAENIVVKTQINPADFDIATLRLMEASHNVATRINGNIIEFVFQTINLDTGGHGNILLKIKTQGDLLTSDIVTNKADIYFDYNFPVETNFANTTFQVLSNSVVTIDNSVGVYPNPVNDMVNIKANTAISSIEIYDVQGRIVHKKITNQKTESIDVAAYSNGIYFLKIKTELGEKVEKIVKK